MSGAALPSKMYERLALKMLAVQTGNFIEVKDAMRTIIASAPEGVNVAFLLSRALAHAADRALKRNAPSHLSWEAETAQLVPIALPGRPLRAENGAVVARRCRSSLVG